MSNFENLGSWSSLYQNNVLGYLKFMLFGSEDKKVIEEREGALKKLLDGVSELGKKNLNRAKKFLENSVATFKKSNDEFHSAFGDFFMGELYKLKEDFEKALFFYQKAYYVLSEKKNLMALEIEKKIKDLQR